MKNLRVAITWALCALTLGVAGSCFYPVEDVLGDDPVPSTSDAQAPGSGGSISGTGGSDPRGSCSANQVCVRTSGTVLEPFSEFCPDSNTTSIRRCNPMSCGCKEDNSSNGKCSLTIAISEGPECGAARAVTNTTACHPVTGGIASARILSDPKDGVDCNPPGVFANFQPELFCKRPSMDCGSVGSRCVPLSGSCLLVPLTEACPIAGWTEELVADPSDAAAQCKCECRRCTGKIATFFAAEDCSGAPIPVKSDGACRLMPELARAYRGTTGGDCEGIFVPQIAQQQQKLCCPP